MRTTCRVCGSAKLRDVVSLGNQYLSDFREDNKLPDQYPLEVIMCQNCTLVQLRHTTPPEKLYNDHYGYKSGINNTIKADLADIVAKATEYHKEGTVVDIGANDGTLLSCYYGPYHKIAYEPVPKLAKECESHADLVINDFFSAAAYPTNTDKAKIITVISCFYDLEDPNKFVSDLVKILDDDGIIVIEQNYLAGMIQQVAFDNICHEHLEFYSLKSLEYLLNRHGLEVFDVETNSINGGAFRTYVRHMNNVDKMRQFERKMKLDNQFTYSLFGMKVAQTRKKVYNFIKKVTDEGKSVYLYGASTRGNTLIQACGLDNTMITAAVERNPEKFGKKIASLQIPIISEEEARKQKPDYMLVLPWFFKEEFIEREKEYLMNGGSFIFPLPEFEVVDKFYFV